MSVTTEQTDLASAIATGSLFINNGITCDIFRVVKASDKAVELRNDDAPKFSVWVPKSALKEAPVNGMAFFTFAKWFVRKMHDEGKPWHRVALGFSTW